MRICCPILLLATLVGCHVILPLERGRGTVDAGPGRETGADASVDGPPDLPGHDAPADGASDVPPDLLARDTTPNKPPPQCASGWCWQAPLPHGHNLHAVWGSAPDHVFAVGSYNTVLHYNGKGWYPVDTGVTSNLEWTGVWGSGPADVYVVGGEVLGTVLHFDGASWNVVHTVPNVHLFDVWGSGSNNVIVVGGTREHWNGTGWTQKSGASLKAIWGSGPQDVYAVGNAANIEHFDGTAWKVETFASTTTANLQGVWASSPTDIWAVGEQKTVLHGNGAGVWNQLSLPSGVPKALGEVWGRSATDLFVASASGVHHFDGAANWALEQATGTVQNDVWGLPSGELFLVGNGGSIYRKDATGWNPMRTVYATLLGVWGGQGDVWAVGDYGTVLHFNGVGWFPASNVPVSANNRLTAVWSAGNGRFVVGDGLILRQEIATGNWATERNIKSDLLKAVWGTGPDVFAVGGDVQVVDKGIILRRSAAGSWTQENTGTIAIGLNGVWGTSSSNVFAVGGANWIQQDRGRIFHWDGNSWTPDKWKTTQVLNAIWGYGPSFAIAVGRSCSVAFYDGVTWTEAPSPCTALGLASWIDLNGVCGTTDKDVYVTGTSGRVLHYDGKNWTAEDPPTWQSLNAVWTSGTDVFVVGANGSILHR